MVPSAEVFWRDDVKLWWPVADGNPQTAYEYVIKRVGDVDHSISRCKRRRTCVQAGGYIGFWPLRISPFFERVLSFEVMPGCFEACRRNCADKSNIEVFELGLGKENGEILPLKSSVTAGGWRIAEDGKLKAYMITIDSLNLNDCDLIVLDIEGYEIPALDGALETISRCKPIIHLEERFQNVELLPQKMKSLGYYEVARVHADAVYAPLR